MKCGKVALVAVLVLMTLAAGCSKSPKIDLGVMTGNVFKHDYFGFTITLPADWRIFSDAEMSAIMEAGKDIYAEGDESKKKALDLAELRVLNFFGVSAYPIGVANNSNILCSAEKLGNQSGVNIGADYLDIIKGQLSSATFVFRATKEIYPQRLGGKEFHVLELAFDTPDGAEAWENIYAIILDNYALLITATYFNPEDLATIEACLNSLTFK